MRILRPGDQIAISDKQSADLWQGRCRWYEMAKTGKTVAASAMLFWLDIDDAPFARKGSMVGNPEV
jgi:hypothetical protein